LATIVPNTIGPVPVRFPCMEAFADRFHAGKGGSGLSSRPTQTPASRIAWRSCGTNATNLPDRDYVKQYSGVWPDEITPY